MFYVALIVLKLVALALSLIPRPLFLVLGHGLGGTLRVLGFRTKIVRGNLDIAYPDWTAEEREKFFRAHYAELGILFLELLRTFYRFDRFFDRYVDVEGSEYLADVLKAGKGAFVMTAHIGNWEVLPLAGRIVWGRTTVMVTKELKPAWFHRCVTVSRELLAVKMACEPRTMQGILRGLKDNNVVGWVMDQYAGAPVGVRVPFFGKPVGSHTALAMLAIRTGTPVVPAIAIRKANGRYLLRVSPAIPVQERATPEATLIATTARYVRQTEDWVREFPTQWLWIHRRWKGDLSPLPPQVEGEMLK